MNNRNTTILSYNIGSSSGLAGLSQLLHSFSPTFGFLQEIKLTTPQLKAQLGPLYDGCSNIDTEDSNKPGTAIIWKAGLSVEVVNIVSCRIQILKTEGTQFVNVYGHPGTQGQRSWKHLFRDDLLPFVVSNKNRLLQK